MFKIKKVIASLACAIMVFMSMSTLCLAAEEFDVQLNRRVTFVGDTYYDWNGKKVRKDNADDKETTGMILSINNRKAKGVYISGQGYIGKDQIKSVEGKILEVEFDKDTLTSSLKFDGDYVNIESTNDGILEYENGVLKFNCISDSSYQLLYSDGVKKNNQYIKQIFPKIYCIDHKRDIIGFQNDILEYQT